MPINQPPIEKLTQLDPTKDCDQVYPIESNLSNPFVNILGCHLHDDVERKSAVLCERVPHVYGRMVNERKEDIHVCADRSGFDILEDVDAIGIHKEEFYPPGGAGKARTKVFTFGM